MILVSRDTGADVQLVLERGRDSGRPLRAEALTEFLEGLGRNVVPEEGGGLGICNMPA